jgi:oligopeptide/dipeptide ABC transporter ATP-binding protein
VDASIDSHPQTLLRIRALRIGFPAGAGSTRPVDGVDLDVAAGRVTCLVGESGSGKSLTALAVMRLLSPAARIEADALEFDGVDLRRLDDTALSAMRGDRMAMIFQEPMTSLNPVFTIGEQIAEVARVHRGLGAAASRFAALEMLHRVRIPAAEARLGSYPHQLSGGMRQRIMIAMALVCRPRLLIADEPTTALDVTIQAQILALMDEMRRELGTSVLLITHDLGVVAELGDDMAVMYAGRIVERAPVEAIFADARHPYTLSLLAAVPRLARPGERLAAIGGAVPSAGDMPDGCRFHPRCPFATDRCRAEAPTLAVDRDGHAVACWNPPIAMREGRS